MSQSNHAKENSHGIQELIDRIHDKGVAAGKEEGIRIVEEAEKRAEWIISQAKEEAEHIKRQSEKDAAFIRNAGKDSLEMAFRDVKLKLKDNLSAQFAAQLKRLIQHEMQDPETLKKLLIEAAAKSQVPDQPMKILLPAHALGLDELRHNPSSIEQGALMEVLSEVASSLFQSGVKFSLSKDVSAGMVFVLKDGEILIEVTDKSLADLLLAHLQPRFRALLEGVVA
ncbi:MAG: hypothetical protein H6998_00150 [Hahellaceae bacterium]|jgi:V/A-type H+-transporting ATPase subunit E|nr:hypothetical protein [Hahellaceae bacterium]